MTRKGTVSAIGDAPSASDRLWSIQDVSAYLGIPVETLRWWRKNGDGPPCGKTGRHLRYDPAAVRAWFHQRAAA